MKRIKIDSLDKLEAFIDNEAVSLENRLDVFVQALDHYPLHILLVKYNDSCTVIENREEVEKGLKRIIAEIQADPNQKFYAGLWVAYEHND